MTSTPHRAPMAAVATMPMRMASHHGKLCWRTGQDGGDDRPHPGVVAGREVDLAEDEDPHLGHAQQHEDRALDQQVGEVAGRQEDRVLDLEDDDQQDEAAPPPAGRRSRRSGCAWPTPWRTRRRSTRACSRASGYPRAGRARPAGPANGSLAVAGAAVVGSSGGVMTRSPAPDGPVAPSVDGVTARSGWASVPVVTSSTALWVSYSAMGPLLTSWPR